MQACDVNWNQAKAEDIVGLIQQTLSGNNEKIKEATRLLKYYSKQSISIRVLSFLLVSSESTAVRQMSTILLKRNLTSLYLKLNVGEQFEFREVLLSQFRKQPEWLVKKGIVVLIALVLPVVELEKWPELRTLLEDNMKANADSPATFLLLNNLLYHFKPPPELNQYLLNALSNSQLAPQAINCIVAIAESQDHVQELPAQLLQLWHDKWPEELALSTFEVLNVICERKFPIIDQVLQWVCQKVAQKRLNRKIRNAALDFLFTFVDFNSKYLASNHTLLKTIVETACLVCSEPESPHEDDEEATQEIALWLIESLASNLKSKKIYPVLLQAAMALINSKDDDKMNTGFLVLAATSEGCPDRLRKNLQNPVMNVLIPVGLNHSHPKVRGAAINALCYFSEFLNPQIVEYHQTIIPSMVNYINDLSHKVAEKAVIAIDVFFEALEEKDIKVYLPIVIPKLNELLVSSQSSPLMRKYAMSAIGSAIMASGLSFQPYVEGVFKTCLEFLKLQASPELNTVRAENISILGRLCNIFCKSTYVNQKEFFQGFIIGILEPVYVILVNEGDPQLKEACFSFFYLLANAIEGEFKMLFEKVMVEVLKSCQMKVIKKATQDFSLDSDSDEEEESTGKITEYDEKAAAIHALGEFAKACPLQFVPYFEQAFKVLEDNYMFFYEGVRMQVALTYENLTLGLVKSQYQGAIPHYQKGLPCLQRYHVTLQSFFKIELIPKLLFIISEDESSKVIAGAIEALRCLVKEVGPVLIDHSLPLIQETIIKLLQKTQILEDEDEGEQQEEEDDTDVEILETLCDFIPTLADTLRGSFEPILNELHPYLMKFLEERDDINDNIQMVGCLSQCFKYTPGYPANFHQEIFLSLNDLPKLNDTDLNRNIAYSYAELFEKNINKMQPYLQDTLITLKNIFENPNSSEPCKDNAIAALCRITYTIYPPMPYQAIITSLVQRMPFKGDQEEQASAIKAILYLANKNAALINQFIPQIKSIFLNDLQYTQKYYITSELSAQMNAFLQQV